MEHSYAVQVTWTGNTGTGTTDVRGYSRSHIVTADGPPDLHGTADPTFRGDQDRWNPEQLLLASISQCHMLSYLYVCALGGVVVTAYADSAAGTMVTAGDGSGRFTEAVLHPSVTVAEESMVAKARVAHERAHQLCFIANSVSFPIRHEVTTLVGA